MIRITCDCCGIECDLGTYIRPPTPSEKDFCKPCSDEIAEMWHARRELMQDLYKNLQESIVQEVRARRAKQ